MICVPKCAVCTGLCKTMEARAVARHKKIEKIKRSAATKSEHLMMMPCGCWALPVELFKVFRSDIKSFICDQHGEMKVTKAWLKNYGNGIGKVIHIPSEFGYQVVIEDVPTQRPS